MFYFKKISLTLWIILLFLFNACKKYEGQGGKSSITGKIILHQKLYINGVYTETVTLSGAKEDVYIVYGEDDLIYDDKVQCNYDGTFKFDFLQPGTYTIFAYNEVFHTGSNVSNNDDDYYTLEPVIQKITLKKKESVDIGTVILTK